MLPRSCGHPIAMSADRDGSGAKKMALPPRPAPGQRSGLLGHSNGYHPSRRKGPPIATLRAAAAGPHLSQWTQTTDGHGQQLSRNPCPDCALGREQAPVGLRFLCERPRSRSCRVRQRGVPARGGLVSGHCFAHCRGGDAKGVRDLSDRAALVVAGRAAFGEALTQAEERLLGDVAGRRESAEGRGPVL